MIKAKALAADGRTLIVLGLSGVNIDRLISGWPIDFDTAQLHIGPGEIVGHICIFYGKDEASMERAMRELITPKTDVFHVPAPPKDPQ